MKKNLLFALSVGFFLNSNAQSVQKAVHETSADLQNNIIDDNGIPGFYPARPAKPIVYNTDRAITRTKIGSSYNAITLYVPASNCLTANQATNLVMFTHRINQNWAATSVNSGFIQSTYSSDYGITWDSLLQVQQQPPNLCRYPSGTIFNPTANTTPGNAYGVVTGPITDGGTSGYNWKGSFFASTKMDKTLNDQQIRLNATPSVGKQWFPRISLQSTDNKVIVTGGLYGGDPGSATATAATNKYRGATINIGTLSGTSFTWALDSIKPSFKTDPIALNNEVLTDVATAWSKDGNTGYVVFIGIDAAATGSMLAYQPIVYKTTTGGTSWNKMAAFDYSGIPAINARLRPSNVVGAGATGPKKAWFSQGYGMDAVVDANGDLHIISVVASGYTTSADSLDFTFNTSPYLSNYIFDTHTTSTGWGASLIDSLRCVNATTNSPFFNTTNVKTAVTARIQASMSTDGTHIFYMWGDSDPTLIPIENVQPEIFGRGYNVTTNLYTPTTQFTYTGDNYFMYISNVALVSGSTYKIPTTISQSRDGSNNVDLTFDHYFVSGIQFDESQFVVGINEIAKNNNLVVTQNYPNPFNKSTSIDVTLKQTTSVSIEIYNMIGQNVMVQNSEKLNAGTHTFTIDGSKLTAGVYFYTVKTGDSSVTQKMIVQ